MHSSPRRKPDRRKTQLRFPTEPRIQRREYGYCQGMLEGKIDRNGESSFSWAGKQVKLRFRKEDAGKEIHILEYTKGAVIVDREWNILRFILREKLPRVK